MLDTLLWISVIISIITSIIRALNIGFQKETYILSSLAHVPILYDLWYTGSNQAIVLNLFYLLIGLMGVYRWHGITDTKIE